MRKSFWCIVIVSLLASSVVSVAGRSVKLSQLNYRGGLMYEINSDKPFTGYAEGMSKDGFLRLNYKNGMAHGEAFTLYSNGQIKYRENYRKGQLHGRWVWYYPNGQIQIATNYKNGKTHGDWIWYNPDGSVKQRLIMRNGRESRW